MKLEHGVVKLKMMHPHQFKKKCLMKLLHRKNGLKLHLKRSSAIKCWNKNSPVWVTSSWIVLMKLSSLILQSSKWSLISLEIHKQGAAFKQIWHLVLTFCSEWPPTPKINERFILGRGVSRWPLWKCSTILPEYKCRPFHVDSKCMKWVLLSFQPGSLWQHDDRSVTSLRE